LTPFLTGEIFRERMFQHRVVARHGDHRVINELADSRLFRLGLEERPETRFLLKRL